MITLQTLKQKFEDKGYDTSTLIFNLPPIPLFDPSCLELSNLDRNSLKETFDKVNKWRFDHYNEKLQELDTWIDRQNYK